MEKLWLGYARQAKIPKKAEEKKPALTPVPQFSNVTMRKKKETGQKETEKEEMELKNVTMRRRKPGRVATHWEEMARESGWMDWAEETILYIKRKGKDNRYQIDLLWKDINFFETQRTRRRAVDPAALKNVRVALMIQELNDKLKMKTPADKEED